MSEENCECGRTVIFMGIGFALGPILIIPILIITAISYNWIMAPYPGDYFNWQDAEFMKRMVITAIVMVIETGVIMIGGMKLLVRCILPEEE